MPKKANLILHTYTRDAVTVNALKDLLDCRRVYRDTAEVAAIPDQCLIVNFGSSKLNPAMRRLTPGQILLNKPESIPVCTSKIRSAAAFGAAAIRIPTPAITKDRAEAQRWLRADGKVLVREDGEHAGLGITVARDLDQLNAADGDFYSRYLDKTHEFRFHVFGETVIDVIEKKHREGYNQHSKHEVFNHQNGFLFFRENIQLTTPMRTTLNEMSIRAVRALNLDFGAVDIMARIENGIMLGYVVCEVNSSPALDGEQAKAPYARAILMKWQDVTRQVAPQAAPAAPRAVGNAWG